MLSVVPEEESAWEKLGGKWPHRNDEADPIEQMYYAVLRGAVATLVDYSDGRMTTDADAIPIEQVYASALEWVTDDDCLAPITWHEACTACGLDPDAVRERVLAACDTNMSFINFVRKQRCAVCGVAPVDPDHWPERARGGTDDRVWPLCRKHHTERHAIGMPRFERKYGVSANECIGTLHERYGRFVGG